jgi:predicted O-methyltransferase YrrM
MVKEHFLTDLDHLIKKSTSGPGDSDRHLMTIFSIALATKGTTYLELGVRNGATTLPILLAAEMNHGEVFSVDINPISIELPERLKDFWKPHQGDAIEFLKNFDKNKKIDFIYVDDWHSYDHVANELQLIDRLVGPSSIILLHDLMWGNTTPFYHVDLTLKEGQWANGGPYRAVAELDPAFWEWSTLPWNNGLTILRKKYSGLYHAV